jgi:hypothetical protein
VTINQSPILIDSCSEPVALVAELNRLLPGLAGHVASQANLFELLLNTRQRASHQVRKTSPQTRPTQLCANYPV